MKIGIIDMNRIKYGPYLNLYFEFINKRPDDEFHLINWVRDNKNEDRVDNLIIHTFYSFQENDVNKIKKIKNFIKFRRYAKKVIKREKFDKIIICYGITSILLGSFILRKYKKNYILDYRDVAYENNWIFQHLINIFTKNAYFVIASSPGFFKYITNNKILLVHNSLKRNVTPIIEKNISDSIRITFFGFIRQPEYNINLINQFANDKRFQLNYYGFEQGNAKILKSYVQQKSINNVKFYGEYSNENIEDILKETDVINNMYDDDFSMKNAMSNKFYFGIDYGIPQIVDECTIMAKFVKEFDLGLTINSKNVDKNNIIRYINSLNKTDFLVKCEHAKTQVLHQNEIIKAEINDYFNYERN